MACNNHCFECVLTGKYLKQEFRGKILVFG
jgi:hypothetical protein